MNIEDLRSDWSKQWNAETSKAIVLKLFRESRESKIQRVLRNQMLHGLFFMFFNLMVMVFTSIVFVEELHNPALSIAAFAMTSLSTVVFYKNVAQLNLLRRIDFSDSILQLQTTVERLKLKRIRHNRFIFVFCLLYFWLAVAILFRLDPATLISTVWGKAPVVVIVHAGMLAIWFPLSIWLLRVYDDVERRGRFWNWLERSSGLTDSSLNDSLNETLHYLDELRKFDSADVG